MKQEKVKELLQNINQKVSDEFLTRRIFIIFAVFLLMFACIAGYKKSVDFEINQKMDALSVESKKVIQSNSQKQIQLISKISSLADSIKRGDYYEAAAFLKNPDALFESKSYILQDNTLSDLNSLQPNSKEAVILDLKQKGIYVGEVGKNGIRQGKGIQVGFNGNYKTINENKESEYYPLVNVYKGQFEDNLANGEGKYLAIKNIGTSLQDITSYEGYFLNNQMHGDFIFTWMKDGQEFSDSIKILNGDFNILPLSFDRNIIARDWDFLTPVSYEVFDENQLVNTFIWDGYLENYLSNEELEEMHSSQFTWI